MNPQSMSAWGTPVNTMGSNAVGSNWMNNGFGASYGITGASTLGANQANWSGSFQPAETPMGTMPTNVNSWNSPESAYKGLGGQGDMPAAQTELPWYKNFSNWGTIANGIGALSSAYLGMKNYKLAKEQLGLSKEAFNANLNNSIKTYNTSLEDRIRGRTAQYDNKENDVQSYLSKHSLKR